MIKLLILVSLFLSMKAFAGYKCEFELAHSEDLMTTIATKTVIASTTDMKSDIIKDFFVEFEKGNKKRTIALKLFMDGWSGEEEMTVAAFRRHEKRSNVELDLISEKVSLRGNARDTLWFDAYKLEIECSLN